MREFAWRDVTVEPVKYAATVAVPREARASGWMSFDLRDTQRSGPAIDGAPQPNAAPYDLYASLADCSSAQFFCPSPKSSVALHFDDPQQHGALPPASSIPAAVGAEWVHRALDFDPSLLYAGTNDVRIDLSGTVQLDRMQVELSYGPPPRRPVTACHRTVTSIARGLPCRTALFIACPNLRTQTSDRKIE